MQYEGLMDRSAEQMHMTWIQRGQTQERFPKPPYTYSGMAAMAIMLSDSKALTPEDIFTTLENMFFYFRRPYKGWKGTIRNILHSKSHFVADQLDNQKLTKWSVDLDLAPAHLFSKQMHSTYHIADPYHSYSSDLYVQIQVPKDTFMTAFIASCPLLCRRQMQIPNPSSSSHVVFNQMPTVLPSLQSTNVSDVHPPPQPLEAAVYAVTVKPEEQTYLIPSLSNTQIQNLPFPYPSLGLRDQPELPDVLVYLDSVATPETCTHQTPPDNSLVTQVPTQRLPLNSDIPHLDDARHPQTDTTTSDKSTTKTKSNKDQQLTIPSRSKKYNSEEHAFSIENILREPFGDAVDRDGPLESEIGFQRQQPTMEYDLTNLSANDNTEATPAQKKRRLDSLPLADQCSEPCLSPPMPNEGDVCQSYHNTQDEVNYPCTKQPTTPSTFQQASPCYMNTPYDISYQFNAHPNQPQLMYNYPATYTPSGQQSYLGNNCYTSHNNAYQMYPDHTPSMYHTSQSQHTYNPPQPLALCNPGFLDNYNVMHDIPSINNSPKSTTWSDAMNYPLSSVIGCALADNVDMSPPSDPRNL